MLYEYPAIARATGPYVFGLLLVAVLGGAGWSARSTVRNWKNHAKNLVMVWMSDRRPRTMDEIRRWLYRKGFQYRFLALYRDALAELVKEKSLTIEKGRYRRP